MKRIYLHIKRLFRKFWFFLFIPFAISPIIGLGVLIIVTILSLLLFSDPIEVKDPTGHFSDKELRKIQGAEPTKPEEYLSLLARYESFQCPIKADKITTWVNSELTDDSYICNYEICDKRNKYEHITKDQMKEILLSQIDKKGKYAQSIIATNRNLVFRYNNLQTNSVEDVIITKEDLAS